MIRRPPRSTLSSSSAASDVYKRQDGGVAEKDVLDLDRRNVLSTRDDHVLQSVADDQVPVVADLTAVARAEPTFIEGRLRGLGLIPVPLHHHVRTGEDFTQRRGADRRTERRGARAVQLRRAILGVEDVPLSTRAIGREKG